MKFSQVFGLALATLPLLISALVSETTGNSIRGFIKRSTASTILSDIEHAVSYDACEVNDRCEFCCPGSIRTV
jgi:hypothetical protein